MRLSRQNLGASQASITRQRTLVEVVIVFALSLGASALYSIVSLIGKLTAPSGLAGQTSKINQSLSEREWQDLAYQLLGISLGLAPVALVIFLLWNSESTGFSKVGFTLKHVGSDSLRGLAIAASIGIPGIALYLGARALGLSSKVEPASLGGYWWVVPVLLLAAIKAAVLEEVIVVGYLHNRLRFLGLSNNQILWISAVIRGSYHLYQGFGGFVGNLVMGLVFMKIYQRVGRTTPLVIAHFLMDAFVFIGYAYLAKVIALP